MASGPDGTRAAARHGAAAAHLQLQPLRHVRYEPDAGLPVRCLLRCGDAVAQARGAAFKVGPRAVLRDKKMPGICGGWSGRRALHVSGRGEREQAATPAAHCLPSPPERGERTRLQSWKHTAQLSHKGSRISGLWKGRGLSGGAWAPERQPSWTTHAKRSAFYRHRHPHAKSCGGICSAPLPVRPRTRLDLPTRDAPRCCCPGLITWPCRHGRLPLGPCSAPLGCSAPFVHTPRIPGPEPLEEQQQRVHVAAEASRRHVDVLHPVHDRRRRRHLPAVSCSHPCCACR